MAATESFTRFSDLPPELRIQIWTEALAVPSVWVAVLNRLKNVYDGGPLPHLRSISMTCIGTSPHLVGLACRESRDVMERLYRQPLRGPIMEATPHGAYWIYLEEAVITFISSKDSPAILDRFGAEISRFRHVTLAWEDWRTHPQTCVRLARSCPALRTVIVQRVDAETSRTWVSSLLRPSIPCEKTSPVVLDLDGVTAARYAALACYDGPEVGRTAGLDITRYRKSILQYFGESPPRLHVLAPGEDPTKGDISAEGPGFSHAL